MDTGRPARYLRGMSAYRDALAARAYQLWQKRGCPLGSPETDWFRAEQELNYGYIDAWGDMLYAEPPQSLRPTCGSGGGWGPEALGGNNAVSVSGK